MTSYVRAMYEFHGEPGSAEISLSVNDILVVTRTDVGEGWWEGKNDKGEVGLFPAAYVEVMSASEVQKQNENGYAGVSSNCRYDETTDELNEGDDWEDDWDEDNETYSEIGPSLTEKSEGIPNSASNYDRKILPEAPYDVIAASSTNVSNATTLKKSGMFGKASDSYILGLGNKEKLSEDQIVHIVQLDNFYYWKANQHSYSVVVASPKKESKFKGMKTFIAYQLTPSFNNISVPGTPKEWVEIADNFEQRWNFPHCCGTLDGKHIMIQAPANCGSEFFNCKKHNSIELLVLVDANYKFLFVEVGAYGRESDGGVFARCPLSPSKPLLYEEVSMPLS